MKSRNDFIAGFSLTELLVALALLALLATLTVPIGSTQLKRSKERELQAALTEIRKAIDSYKNATSSGLITAKAGASGYPANLKTLVEGEVNQQDIAKKRIFFLRRIPRDPFSEDYSVSNEDTWRLRSYESSPTNPEAGDDVFDISSSSEAIGLNGVPYHLW